MGFKLDAINAENFIYILIIILVYVIAQRITIKQIKSVLDRGEKEFKKRFNNSLIDSTVVNSMLDGLLYDLHADRAYVFQYHNGGSNINGIPFARCSNTHERCEVGITSHIKNYQNLPVAMYGFRNDLVASGSIIQINDIEKLKETDKSAYNLLKAQNIKSLYVIGLYTSDKRAIGFLGLDYLREVKIFNNNDIKTLETVSDLISKNLCKEE